MQNMYSENSLRISTKLIRSPPSLVHLYSKSTQWALKGQSKATQRTIKGHLGTQGTRAIEAFGHSKSTWDTQDT